MFEPLLPLNFLRRAARLFPEKTAVVDGEWRYTYLSWKARPSPVQCVAADGRGAG